jgi:hypothetical protein
MWRVLLVHLTTHPRAVRLTIRQHLDALERIPSAWVLPYNAVHGVPSWLGRLRFDAVVLDTTILCMRWIPWYDHWRRRSDWLAELDALKIALPQDEYHHADTLDEWLDDVGVTVIGTVLDERHRGELYPRMARKAAFYDLLTGYIDGRAAEAIKPRLRPPGERELDIVYRARNLPYWLGSHGQLKHRIGEAAARRAAAHSLRFDISTRPQETVLGDAWLNFMARGRATVGAESGSSTLDHRGEMSRHLDELLAEHPDLTFEEYASQMPPGWDDYQFFAVSPRHLEAVVTRTAQILVEGSYSGVLEAGRHYIPVRRDLSDLDEALEAAKDTALLEQLADQAYRDIYESGQYSFRRLTETVEEMLYEHAPGAGRGPARAGVLAKSAAAAEGWTERVVVGPVATVSRIGREGYRELFGGVRLFVGNAQARRLIVDYLRSTETRTHVAPRRALADFMALAAIHRAKAGKFDGLPPFDVSVDVDADRRRFVLRSHADDRLDGGEPPTVEELASLLERGGGWEFFVDHSEVGPSLTYPLIRSKAVEVPLRAGPSSLSALNWLARYRPRHVAAALSPVLRQTSSTNAA